jgi:hypothetical protein
MKKKIKTRIPEHCHPHLSTDLEALQRRIDDIEYACNQCDASAKRIYKIKHLMGCPNRRGRHGA